MELEQPPMIREGRNSDPKHGQKLVKPPKTGDHEVEEDEKWRLDSFRVLERGVPGGPPEKKLAWLRSQVIGCDLEFETPFGKRRLTYADYTASGRSLYYIENYIINNVLPVYGNTHTSDSYVGHQTTKIVHEASRYVKSCLGGKEEDAILFLGSGTTAAIKRLQEVMGISVPSTMRERVLKELRNEERWVVFVGPYEHHSNLLSWRQSLAEVVEIGLDQNGLIDINALKLELESFRRTNRPMLGSFSACSNVTGIYSDTRALASLLHRYGAFACFDFAASGPYVEIDMRSGEMDGYDAIFLSPHKFVGGPGTPGILLMSKVLYQLKYLPPSTCGGGTVSFVNGFSEKDTLYYDEVEEREDAGTPPIVQKVRAAMAFWVKEYIGYEAIKEQEHRLIEAALDRLLSNPNIWVLGNTSVKRQAILSFLVFSTTNSQPSSHDNHDKRFRSEGGIYMWREYGNMRDKPLHGPFVAKLLNDLFGIQARGGCACAGPYGHYLLHVDEHRSLAFREAIQKGYNGVKPGWTRVNFSYHMSIEEFEFLLAALEFIAMYGQRFLPLYDFNWNTGSWTIKKKSLKEIQAIKQSKPAGFSNLLISRALQAASFEVQDESKDNACDLHPKTIELIDKFVCYLETAKRIAHSLPKFPPARDVPQDIGLDLVPFRV